ncbi:MAG: hypothetical protein OEY49_00525 [Candidatus Heimdallarchaeota archaeon]|nr:hypothetical protein [Candidatus Heimdallarchaeota archaeon]
MNINISKTLLILIIFAFAPINTNSVLVTPVLPEVDIEMNISINFINFDTSLLDLNSIRSQLQFTYFYNYYGDLNYDVILDLQVPDQSYTDQLNAYIDTITTDDWTSKLNETAINEQKVNFVRKDIFEQQNGKAIDARLLEQYLSANKPSTNLNDNNLYHMFVFNLSRLDIGTNKHWLNATEIDPDSMSSRFYWRLEWDYPLNYDVKFPYAAFSEQTDVAILDPTSFQWVLNWRSIWNDNTIYHPSYDNTLTELINNETPSNARPIVTDTTSKWITDWLENIYGMGLFGEGINLRENVNSQTIVVYNSTQKSEEELRWIINEQLSIDKLGYIANSTNIEFVVNYYDINNDTFLKDLIENAEIDYSAYQGIDPPFENWRFYNGDQLWGEIFSNSILRGNYFERTDATLPIKGLILLLDNASYAGDSWIPWTGGLYTGLGGNGIVTMLWELDRAFMPDGTTHKAGLSKVLIHEIGHSIGLPHTFGNSFVSDFISDVMGYYPGTANFSVLISQAFWRRNLDKIIFTLYNAYTEAYTHWGSTFPDLLPYLDELYLNAMSLHAQKLYLESYTIIQHAHNVINNPYNYVSEFGSLTSRDITNSSTSGISEPRIVEFNATTLLLIPVITWFLRKKTKMSK